jgi:nitrate/TMAO reductase-like tetraheme cytochrome c subunit
VSVFHKFRDNWIRPALFFGNNPISLAGGAITTASVLTMVGSWVIDLFGHGNGNPYLGIIFFLILPAFFILGLLLIPVGVFLRRRKLQKAGQIPAVFPTIDLNDHVFRHGLDIVLVATIVNMLIVLLASYRGVAYMDSPQFCGQACHVMHPEYAAYQVSAHSHVPCTECHVGSGIDSYVRAKMNGTKQLIEVTLHPFASLAPKLIPDYPTPIPSPVTSLRPAREVCESCHTPAKFVGDKLLVKTSYADDESNTAAQTVVLLHIGGRDSLAHLSGIHGVHLNHMEYIASSSDRQTIPWVSRRNGDGSETVFAASALNGATPKGEHRTMDCIDCHNRATHTFQTPEEGINQAMTDGAISPSLPWIHKEGLELLKTNYASQAEAKAKIAQQLNAFYRAQHPDVLQSKGWLVKQAADQIYAIYARNVFPEMKVTWGTHPNNLGHTAYPGCFRCHDGDHTSKGGKTITQDCANCHNLLAVEESKPKVLSDLGIAH